MKCVLLRDTFVDGSRGSCKVEENEREELIEVREVASNGYEENLEVEGYDDRSLSHRWRNWVDWVDR